MSVQESPWKERLALLRRRGGLKAAAFWLAKKLLRVDLHFIYVVYLSDRPVSSLAPATDFRAVLLHTLADVAALSPSLVDEIEEQSGSGVARLVESGSSIYALLDGSTVVSQLNVCWNGRLKVDTPARLDIALGPTDGFLGYLYTHPGYRGVGAASKLIALACADAAHRGQRRLFTHIRATNAPSLNTFEKGGWRRDGWMVTSTAGRLLKVHVSAGAGVEFQPERGDAK